MVNPIIVALDVPTLEEATRLGELLRDEVGGFKVGMELLMGAGPRAIESVAALGSPVFADAKLHDIPHTVERAAARIKDAGARWVTVHASGGRDMIEAANAGMGHRGVLAVTVLTSLEDDDLPELGIEGTVSGHVLRMAQLGAAAAVEGVVCSPGEVRAVKQGQWGLKVFTPGVRPRVTSDDDQKRTATPEQAIVDGADHLVIGRPITRADDPVESARKIAASIASSS